LVEADAFAAVRRFERLVHGTEYRRLGSTTVGTSVLTIGL
jgi:hypothetical protein